MANSKAALKYIRKTATRTLRNRQVKSRLKTLARKVDQIKESGDSEAIAVASRNYISELEKAAGKGIVHANKVSRHKSRLATIAVSGAAPASEAVVSEDAS
jgi:small subunit ribosomal protein S20